jgi:hypothetical protein
MGRRVERASPAKPLASLIAMQVPLAKAGIVASATTAPSSPEVDWHWGSIALNRAHGPARVRKLAFGAANSWLTRTLSNPRIGTHTDEHFAKTRLSENPVPQNAKPRPPKLQVQAKNQGNEH